MWIFCCGMYRSGSTVQYNLVKELVETKTGGKALGVISRSQFSEQCRNYDHKERNFVVKCHRFIPDAVPFFQRGEASSVYVYRDPRDIIVSAMRKSEKSFEELDVTRLLRDCIQSYHEWHRLGNILVSKYETMVIDLKQETLRIALHLNIDISEAYALELAEKYAIERQKKRIQDFDYQNDGIRLASHIYDPETLLHPNHIHTGKSGQWKTELSPLQVAVIEAHTHDWLVTQGYPTSQSWSMRKLSCIVPYIKHKAKRLKKRVARSRG